MKNVIKTAEVADDNQGLIAAMRAVEPRFIGGEIARAKKALAERAEAEPESVKSKDWKTLEAFCGSEARSRLFIALKIDVRAYVLNGQFSDAELVKRGLSPDARTVNLKAYKKVTECAEYLLNPKARCESVFKTFVACAILATRNAEVLPRDVCTRFLNSHDLRDVSADLADALDTYRAKHMTGGAETQTSQCVLTLANLQAGRMVRDGRTKHFALDAKSPLVAALALRFGMTEALQSIPDRTPEPVEPEAQPEGDATV